MSGNGFLSKSIKLRGLLYGLVALSSVVVFGNISEACHLAGTCPSISIGIIFLGVLATVIASLMCAAIIIGVDAIVKIEQISSIVLVIMYSISVSLVSSFRNRIGLPFEGYVAISVSWFALLLSVILLYVTFVANDANPLFGKSDKDDSTEEQIPEEMMGADGTGEEEEKAGEDNA